METLCSTIKGLNPYHVAAGTVAQLMFGVLWFDLIVSHLHRYYFAADKGVRRAEHAIHRYPKVVVLLATAAAAAARMVVVLVIAATVKASTLEDYQYIAAIAAAVMSINVHQYLMSQRPFQLIVTEVGYQIMDTMIAAVVAFYMKKYNV